MIADVLSDAVGEIESYEADGMYSDPVFKAKLALVKGVMTALRAELDCVPGITPYVSPAAQSGIQRVAWKTEGGFHEWVIDSRGMEG